MLEKLAKQTAIYGISTIVVRFLNYLLTPYYTRIFDQGEYGIVTENDEEALLEGVTIILDDPVLLQKYRIAAKERGESFNSEQTVGEVEKMLLQICK